jgi:16S rRNA (adenine1518-N6/adenine1519-N6)-dimethyltransferase
MESAPNGVDLPPLRDVIARWELSAKRRFGQHFLLDQNLTGRIARTGGDLSKGTIIEVGPGPGGLTRSLLAAGAERLVAIEKDERCLCALEDLEKAYPPGRLRLIEGDALETNLAELGPPPRKIIANLPYNVATPLLIGWLKQIEDFDLLILMFQKEVAERLVAPPGGKDYGRLSVITQWLCETRILFNIDNRAFTPPPKVASSLVSLIPRPEPLAKARIETLEKVTAAAFGQRRKMLRASLKPLLAPLGLKVEDLGLDPKARAETLAAEEFCAIARAIDEGGGA